MGPTIAFPLIARFYIAQQKQLNDLQDHPVSTSEILENSVKKIKNRLIKKQLK